MSKLSFSGELRVHCTNDTTGVCGGGGGGTWYQGGSKYVVTLVSVSVQYLLVKNLVLYLT